MDNNNTNSFDLDEVRQTDRGKAVEGGGGGGGEIFRETHFVFMVD